jgi:hypothetical protein
MTKANTARIVKRQRKAIAISALDNIGMELIKISGEIKPEAGIPGKWVQDNFKIIINEMKRVKMLIE